MYKLCDDRRKYLSAVRRRVFIFGTFVLVLGGNAPLSWAPLPFPVSP